MTVNQIITRRYIFALALVAVVLISSYIVVVNRMHQNEDDGEVINRAGQQRMLSQRVALLMREVISMDSKNDSETYAKSLEQSLQQMKENHQWLYATLKEDASSPRLIDMYERNQGIRELTDIFLTHGDRYMSAYRQNPRDTIVMLATSDVVASIARNGFVQQLDDVVKEHLLQFERDIMRFKQLKTLILGIGLSLLVMEAIFIFRPMARSVDSSVALLEQRNQELSEFSLRLSHDLRAPVASSIGMAEIAKDAHQSGDAEETDYALTRLQSLLEKLDQTIVDIVNVTRAGIAKPDPEVILLNEVIHEVVDKLSTLEGCGKIKVETDVSSPGPVIANKVFLQQIVENLVSNAIKYANFNQEQPAIQISTRQSGKSCQISVADNGVGIEPQHRDELFGMFKRFHPNVAFGSGLGLYLVQQNASALGGKVEYRPLEPGSQFTLTFNY
ncbi:MAG: ATP-binding protein [Gammaproteobacteria bacterium]